VATDLLSRREVWFQRGPLDVAIRASIALPGIFTPVVLNGRVLVDGGLMDPVPIAPTAAVPADLTVAISLGGERTGGLEAGPAHETAEPRPLDEWADRFRRRAAQALETDLARSLLARLPSAAAPAAEEVAEDLTAGLTKLDVMNQSLEAMQSLVTRFRLAGYPPDVLVTVPKDACRTLDFHRAEEVIALGRQLTADALDAQ
jgi:NTE family protein